MSTGRTAVLAGFRVRRTLGARRLRAELAQGRGRAWGIVLLGLAVGATVFGVACAASIYVTWRGAPELVRSLVSVVLLGLSGALVLSSLGHAANSFFSAKDLWFWDSTPVPRWARFVDRATDTAVHALPMTLALGALAIVGSVVGAGLGVAAVARAIIAVVLTGLIPMSLGIVLAHVGGALLPAGKLRRVSLLFLGVAVAAGLVWFRRARIEKVLTEEGAAELLATARSYKELGPAFLPSSYGSSFIIDGSLTGFAGLMGWSLGMVALALLSHRFLSTRARDLAVDESPVGIIHGSLRDRALKAAVRPVEKRLRPVVEKDLLAFLRDPAQWGQVLLLLGVGALYLVNADALRQGFAQMPEIGAAILPAMHTGLVAFIAAGLAVRFAFPQVGLEGPAVWIVDGSPLHPRQLMTAKWIASMPVVVIYPSLIGVAGGFVLDMNATLWIATTVICAVVSLGVAAFGVGRGALKPLFDAASLSELAMGPGAISTMMWSVAYAFIGSVGALFAGIFVATARVNDWPVAVGVAGSALCVLVPCALAWNAGQKALLEGSIAFVRRREDEAERAFAERASSEQRTIVIDE